jgi:predicted nucleic acid-binding protein
MGQKIGLDAVVFIYLLENKGATGKRAEKVLKAVENGKLKAVLSGIGVVEILVGPKKLGLHNLALQYKELITHFPNLIVSGINENIVDIASDLRAHYSIKTPDAIHIATAIDFGAERFFTNDKSLIKVKEISVVLV